MDMIPHSSSDITKHDIEAVLRVLESNYVGYNSETKNLEKDLSSLIMVNNIYAVNSGSSALSLAFKLLDLPKGSKVVTTTYACLAIVNSICSAGLIPFFVDVGSNTVNADIEKIINACRLNTNVCAILYPHIGGYPSEISILRDLKIPIIEDCAASLGAETSNGHIGKIGDIAIFSFGSTKLITGGNGGAIAIRDQEKAKQIEYLLDYEGEPNDYLTNGFESRYNERMSNVTAALTRSQLFGLDKRLYKRRDYANHYLEAISKYDDVKVPNESNSQCSFWRFIFFSSRKKDWISHFRKLRIDARPSIAHQLHRYFGLSKQKFPNADLVDNELISLPIHTRLSNNDVKRIIHAIETFD